MKINNIEVDFDIFDTENLKKFEIGVEKVDKELHNTTNKSLKQYEKVEIYCKSVIDFCIDLFGEEKANSLIESKTNFLKLVRLFGQIVDSVNEEKKLAETEFNKYTPNRAQRRAKK